MSVLDYSGVKGVQTEQAYLIQFYASLEQLEQAKEALNLTINATEDSQTRKSLIWLGLQLKNKINGLRDQKTHE